MKSIASKLVWIVLVTLMGLGVQRFSGYLYQEAVLVVDEVQIAGGIQTIDGRLIKNNQVKEITIPYYESEATVPKFKAGDQLLLKNEEFYEVKRDGYLFIIVGYFVLALLFIGKKDGIRSLLSLTINIGLLFLLTAAYVVNSRLPLLGLTFAYCIAATTASLVLSDGWQGNTLQKIIATLLTCFSAFFICYVTMNLMQDRGVRYEEMQFLTRPYRPIFLASLLIGTLGAVMDTVVTVLSTLEELLKKKTSLTTKELFLSGRTVGQDIAGSMVNVLLFAYLSGAIPMILLYLINGWNFLSAVNLHISLELLRALCGGFGIVLSIPISLLVFRLARGRNR